MAASIHLSKSLSSLNLLSQHRPQPRPPSQITLTPFSTSPLSRSIKLQNPFSPVKSKQSTSSLLPSVYSNTLLCKYKSGAHNVEVVPEEDEDGESFLMRFRREVYRARIIPECNRRRYHETNHEKRKRKSMEAARKYGSSSRRRLLARRELEEKERQEKEKEEMEDAVDIDEYEKENWDESIVDEVPYC